MAVNYDEIIKACNPTSPMKSSDLDKAIEVVMAAVFPGLSHEEVALSSEDADAMASAVRHRLGIYLPTKVLIKRMLNLHK